MNKFLPPFYCRSKNPLLRGLAFFEHVLKAKRGRVQTPWQRCLAHFETLFIDNTLFSFLFLNKHRVTEKLWRAGQPHPFQIRGLAKAGIRTIINLRGERDCASYYLEEQACQRHGIALVNVTMESKRPPTREKIAELAQVFSTTTYPALMHCKSGADRTGLAAALCLMIHDGRSVEEAQKQLSLRYGHLASSKTGVLDAFLAAYQKAAAQEGVTFLAWAQSPAYDREAIMAVYKPRRFVSWLGDLVLRRE
ncbi:MAG: sulfur transferase domain-containing protein [Bdellovibrionales bacterium]|jgi:protein tyrosine phosphatase (PTP) superfamily phosphohydrolase (DUF442 family)